MISTNEKPEAREDSMRDRNFVDALSRGLQVLQAFSKGGNALCNKDIASITGLTKSTVTRLTYTLTQIGFLRYSSRLGRYQLSSAALGLGYNYVVNLRVRQLAKPYMDEFARRNKVSIALSCRDYLHMINVENSLPPDTSMVGMEIGFKLSMLTTSAGRAYCSAIGEKERSLLVRMMKEKYRKNWPELEAGLSRAVSEYREHGFCFSLSERQRGINSAGVPIVLRDGTVMSLSCAAPSFLVPLETLKKSIAHQLAILGRDIESLGV